MVQHAKTLAEDELEQLLPQAKKKPNAENQLQVPGQSQPDGISCFASEQQINDDLADQDEDATGAFNANSNGPTLIKSVNATTDKRVEEEDQ